MRPHQWSKNALLAVPLLAAHQWSDVFAWSLLLWAFLAFSALASAIYIINDLVDLDSDRRHPRKRTRPLASGDLSISQGVGLAALLLVVSAVVTLALPRDFQWILLLYFITTLAYSFWLKRFALVDVGCLAGLYTLRVVAGAVVTQTPLSYWLVLFAIFLFLSLALASIFVFQASARWRVLAFVLLAVPPATAAVWFVTGGFSAASGLRWLPGWMQGEQGAMFWILNFGVLVVLLPMLAWKSLVRGNAESRAFGSVAIGTFLLCAFVAFAPWEWDNTKLLLWAWLAAAPLLWERVIAPLPALLPAPMPPPPLRPTGSST
jgi:4-hydroxybenzoate polyprenyltransferase